MRSLIFVLAIATAAREHGDPRRLPACREAFGRFARFFPSSYLQPTIGWKCPRFCQKRMTTLMTSKNILPQMREQHRRATTQRLMQNKVLQLPAPAPQLMQLVMREVHP